MLHAFFIGSLSAGLQSIWLSVYALWITSGTIFLLAHRRRPATTLAWILALWSLPVLSTVFYFFLGPRRMNKQSELRQLARSEAAKVIPTANDATLSDDFDADHALASLALVTQRSGARKPRPRKTDGVQLYRNGVEAFSDILSCIQKARHQIHIEYYIWQPDTIGTGMRDALIERSRAGVKVRLVVDAIGAKNCIGDFWEPLVAAGAEVRKFNAPRPFKPQPGKMNYRTHRKILITDNHTAFLGGINVSDDNINTGEGRHSGPWRCTHARIKGDVCFDLQAIFLEDWLYSSTVDAHDENSSSVLSPSGRKSRPTLPDDAEAWFKQTPANASCNKPGVVLQDVAAEPDSDISPVTTSSKEVTSAKQQLMKYDEITTDPWVQIVDSGPDEPTEDIRLLFFSAINQAQSRVWMSTAYFVPDTSMETALASACSRGVDVQLLIPANGDSALAEMAARTFCKDMIDRGARIWLYEPTMTHSKTLLIDDDLAIVGTANLDNRSFRLNFEVVAAFFDEAVAAQVEAMFLEDVQHSRPMTNEGKQSLPSRIRDNTVRLLAPLL